MRFLNKLDTIDRLVADEPTDATASCLPTDESGQDTLDGYFLGCIKGDAWLTLAKQVFQRCQDTSSNTAIAFFTFLLSCSGTNAVEAALANAQGDSPNWQSILKVARMAGIPAANVLLKLFAEAETIGHKRSLRDVVSSVLRDAFDAGDAAVACAVLRRFLRIERDPLESQVPPGEGRRRLSGLDPSIGLDPYALQEFLSALVAAAPTSSALPVMNVFAEVLSDAIRLSYWPEDRADQMASGYDGSAFWRPAVEEHEQNSDSGSREQLVVAIRRLGERILDSSGNFNDIDASLGNNTWAIFKRIRLHLIRRFPSVAGERVRQALADMKLRRSDTWHEWALLLSEQFGNLADEEQIAILSWMTESHDPSKYVQRYREIYKGADPTAEDLARWKAERSRKRLAVIKDSIPEYWRKTHSDLCANLDAVEHPTFRYYTSGGAFRYIEEESPKRAAEIAALPPCDLVSELAQWREKDPYAGPSEWGLLAELKKAAKSEPTKILSQLTEYRDLAIARHCAILEGIWEAANDGASTDWWQLLIQTKNITQERILPAALENGERGDEGVSTPIVRAMEIALEKKLPPSELRQAVSDCIAAFLAHPDPRPSTEEIATTSDTLSSQSLNTPRPIAIRCLFAYDEWLRAACISEAEEILDKLAHVLQTEKTLGGRSVFGEKLNWFLRYHPKWTKKHLGELLPPDAPAKRAAVWSCFVTMCGASKVALEILRSEYERAIESCREQQDDKLSSDWSPHKGLVRHLCAYYWWGLEPIERPSLVTLFFETAPANLRVYAFNYLGQALANTEEELPPEVSQRFQALADWRIKAIQASETESPEQQELHGFVRWVNAEKLPAEWSLHRLLEVLTLVSSSFTEHQMLPFEFLAKHAEQFPALTVGCMHALTFGRKKAPPWWGQENEAKKVLRVALASKDKKTIRQAEEIQDQLLRLQRWEYRNLEHEGKQDSSRPS